MKHFTNFRKGFKNSFTDFVSDDFFDGEELDFHRSINGYKPIPLTQLITKPPVLSNRNIWIKDESKRFHLKAFKALGASFAIKKFIDNNPGQYVFCTATDGNHGRAVAWASAINCMQAVIFVPISVANETIQLIRQERAEVRVVNSDYDHAVKVAAEFAHDTGSVLIQDTSFEGYSEIPGLIMKGYLTQMRESEFTLPDTVILQAGVGTWAASVILFFLKYFPDNIPKFIIVEPEEVAGCLESAKAGYIVKASGKYQTVMAGLNCPTPATEAIKVLTRCVDHFIGIPDELVSQAQEIYKKNEIDSGSTGASGLAGLLAVAEIEGLLDESDKNILIFNTEGKISNDSEDL
ncbi:MAG: pyridoxal-phosphate dependent enzyme [Ignavibacteriaceae bacterium]|nr:MAG: pyridoxal-phosphate dependent enzyme [Chlorobiota bacterium]MBV6399027.1 Diaminopropionate ammonia-lyase [Ignavibacteria bacterium]MCC6885944.1 pyridoxal-phosphate dependent enzyme [Ignavibacteriales bacterium]MCE7953399.1 pyridoxal-phosphate dependent enzyme [Chlorobi bacterium CHB7]MDL1887335.1 pyridoxal-phosphate dependent enzyme [Ignavibacteria bacterium CHB1]MEB2330102.1 pyridoxal-phosphate dependent enzyme [Ignavibacteriaceae bacterium]RIK48729.1 MAG: diaminopropionate ammonia-l